MPRFNTAELKRDETEAPSVANTLVSFASHALMFIAKGKREQGECSLPTLTGYSGWPEEDPLIQEATPVEMPPLSNDTAFKSSAVVLPPWDQPAQQGFDAAEAIRQLHDESIDYEEVREAYSDREETLDLSQRTGFHK